MNEAGKIICIEDNLICPGIVKTQCALGSTFSIKNCNGDKFLDSVKVGRL